MENDREMYHSCERIRAFVSLNTGAEVFVNPGSGAKKILDIVHKGSEINALISQSNWEELFSNKEWLNVLEFAQNLSFLKGDRINPELKLIAQRFPEQTKYYLEPETL